MAIPIQTERIYSDQEAIGIIVRRSSHTDCQLLAKSVCVLR